jgi:hypothetical protein
MHSFMGPGEDEGRGGVVVFSAGCQYLSNSLSSLPHLRRPSMVPKRLAVKSDRRGVGSWGLQIS